MSDLVERLRMMADPQQVGAHFNPLYAEAATALEAKDKEIEALRKDVTLWKDEHACSEINFQRDLARAETAERSADTWHRICETIATILDLPEPEIDFSAKVRDKFDALSEQIHDSKGVADLAIKHRETAERERDEARAALKFYAEPSNWQSPSTGFAAQYDPEPSLIKKDGGATARAVIAAITEAKGK